MFSYVLFDRWCVSIGVMEAAWPPLPMNLKTKIMDKEKLKAEIRDLCMDRDADEAQGILSEKYGAEYDDEWLDDCIEPDEVWVKCTSMRARGIYIKMYYSTEDDIVSEVTVEEA